MKLSLPSTYTVTQDGKPAMLRQTDDFDYPTCVELTLSGLTTKVEVVRR